MGISSMLSRWQVFGLADTGGHVCAEPIYWPSLPNLAASIPEFAGAFADQVSAVDGGRFHLPLRGQSRFFTGVPSFRGSERSEPTSNVAQHIVQAQAVNHNI